MTRDMNVVEKRSFASILPSCTEGPWPANEFRLYRRSMGRPAAYPLTAAELARRLRSMASNCRIATKYYLSGPENRALTALAS